MMRIPLPLLLAVATACCTGARHDAATTSAPPLTIAALNHIDRKAREPMVAEHPDGTLFVAGYGEPTPMLWRSVDQGPTWTRVDVGRTEDGAVGNSDVDLAIAADGTLYFVTMVFDAKAGEGRRISVGVSHDVGQKWTWTRLSEQRYDDRPWVDVAADGTAHVIWNDGLGVNHCVSTDGGATWARRSKLSGRGGSSHLAVGPGRRVAARVTPLSASGSKMDGGVDLIITSQDGGMTWHEHPAPGDREWKMPAQIGPTDTLRWVEPMAWDAGGTLYSAWADHAGVWLARSRDEARTWRISRVAATAGFYPYLIARDAGQLAVTWFSGSLSPSADRSNNRFGFTFWRVSQGSMK